MKFECTRGVASLLRHFRLIPYSGVTSHYRKAQVEGRGCLSLGGLQRAESAFQAASQAFSLFHVRLLDTQPA